MEFSCAFAHDGADLNAPWCLRMDLLWLIAEAAVALALLLGIVWWTWPKKP
jgi:hypothetical protein